MADAGYPAHWAADVVLADGSPAHLRPILPSDADGLVAFYSRVSDQSKYFRFFAPYPTLSERDVERFTNVDHRSRVAFVVTVGPDIVAVGRYDSIDEAEAEVAFLVQDAHQGRGIGQLLLEHLAQAGRERGLAKFVADVLPENVRMIHVFRQMGYQVEGGYEEGVMHLVFPIEPTDTAVGVMRSREHRADYRSIERFFTARSVAVVGASRREDAVGRAALRNLVGGGFTGRVYAVNPDAESIAGLPAYPTVQEIPGPVDLAVIAVPAETVQEVVLDCAAKGVHGLVVMSSGFAEQGEEGSSRQRRLVQLARSYGLRLVGPNCLGVVNTATDVSLNASLSPIMPPRGRVGFFCQSGALGVAILEKVDRRGLGLSTFVSAGNRADVSGNDLLQYWADDDATEVVLLYLESIGNPRKFSRVARQVARVKPVIAVKSGRTTQGVPIGHAVRRTIAPAAAVDAMFKQAGVIQVDTLDEMFDVAQLLAHQPLPRGPRVAVVGNSNALGILVADAAAAAGLQVRLPVGLGADATAEEFDHALHAAIDHPEVDSVIAVFVPPIDTSGKRVAEVLAVVGERSGKPLISSFLGTEGLPELLRVADAEGAAGRGSVPSYPAPEAAVRALAKAVGYSRWLGRDQGTVPAFADVDVEAARRLVAAALKDNAPTELSAAQLMDLLAAYGIELWRWFEVATADEAVSAAEELGWGVVLKATSPRLRQRPDLAGVWRNIETAAEMQHAWRSLIATVGSPADAGYVVQQMAGHGVPLTVRSMEDPLFGPIVSFGVAGIASELLDDWAYRIPPLTDIDAAEMVREIKAAPLLLGYGGGGEVDLEAVEELVARVAELKNDLPEVEMLDLTLALAGSFGVRVLGAAGRVGKVSEGRAEEYTRRLTPVPGEGDARES